MLHNIKSPFRKFAERFSAYYQPSLPACFTRVPVKCDLAAYCNKETFYTHPPKPGWESAVP